MSNRSVTQRNFMSGLVKVQFEVTVCMTDCR